MSTGFLARFIYDTAESSPYAETLQFGRRRRAPHTEKHKNMYQKERQRKQLKKEPAERRKIDVLPNGIRRIGGQDSSARQRRSYAKINNVRQGGERGARGGRLFCPRVRCFLRRLEKSFIFSAIFFRERFFSSARPRPRVASTASGGDARRRGGRLRALSGALVPWDGPYSKIF